ncbi:MAG: cbb3-type cytochrome c oxidase subunit I [Anaeromyxobacter sp.]
MPSRSSPCSSWDSKLGTILGSPARVPGCANTVGPFHFFVAVAFWNLVGAGLFGFMINPPIALYYMQGLNTTPVHGHAALFGVYGMLGIGLMLFCFRTYRTSALWKEGPLRFAFWAINGGLMAMVLFSLLPVGLMQTWASVEHGYWYARSSEFLQQNTMHVLRWMRAFGDTVFAIGTLTLMYFVLRISMGDEHRSNTSTTSTTSATSTTSTTSTTG